jgi:hypothetical protein
MITHIMPLVIAPVAAPLDGLELWKFLFPVTQHVRLHATQFRYLTDSEVTFTGNDG